MARSKTGKNSELVVKSVFASSNEELRKKKLEELFLKLVKKAEIKSV